MADNLYVQIFYDFILPISEYQKRFLSKTLVFPDFSAKCPICGLPNCASKHAVYERYLNHVPIPIQRWICKNNDRPKDAHHTFSVLPYQAIPYCRYEIDFAQICYQNIVIDKKTRLDVSINISQLYECAKEFLATVMRYALIFQAAITKWDTFCERNTGFDGSLLLMDTQKRSAACSAYDLAAADFLFGTPSQKRIRSP